MLKALKVLRPDISAPSRDQLGGPLLRKAYLRIKGNVDKILKKDYITGYNSRCEAEDEMSDSSEE